MSFAGPPKGKKKAGELRESPTTLSRRSSPSSTGVPSTEKTAFVTKCSTSVAVKGTARSLFEPVRGTQAPMGSLGSGNRRPIGSVGTSPQRTQSYAGATSVGLGRPNQPAVDLNSPTTNDWRKRLSRARVPSPTSPMK